MKLADFEIQRAKVRLPGKGKDNFLEVRGLSLDDLTLLISLHHEPITKALKLWQESRTDIMTTRNLSSFILAVAKDFPDLVAEVISAAADELDDEARRKAKLLPVTVQIVALNEILKLTMEEVDGLKNLLAEMQDRVKSLASVGSSANPSRQTKN